MARVVSQESAALAHTERMKRVIFSELLLYVSMSARTVK